MLQHKIQIIVCILVVALTCRASSYGAILGKACPSFAVVSGDDRRLTRDMIKGKVAIIFYETKEASTTNADIKDRFNILYDRQDEAVRNAIVRMPVFDCSHVVWPISLVWKDSLRKLSKKYNMTLYADWEGRMWRDFEMKENDSNVLLIDKTGKIRYQSHGRISDQQFKEIEGLLDRLVNQEN